MSDWLAMLSTAGFSAVSAGAVLAAAWALIKSSLESKISESIKHNFSIELERQKAENTIIVEKVKLASAACNDLGLLVDEINEKIYIFQDQAGGPDYFEKLMRELHPEFKRRYTKVRPRFEVNDVFSAYSLMLDRLTHPQNVRKIIGFLGKQSRGNIRFMYGKMWVTVAEVIRSVDRISTNYDFWNPKVGYGERADEWAEHDFQNIMKFLNSAAQSRDNQNTANADFSPFYISLEKADGRTKFWNELPAKSVSINN